MAERVNKPVIIHRREATQDTIDILKKYNYSLSDRAEVIPIDIFVDIANDLYKYFPRIFNEWDNIVMNNKHRSLKTIIEFLQEAKDKEDCDF